MREVLLSPPRPSLVQDCLPEASIQTHQAAGPGPALTFQEHEQEGGCRQQQRHPHQGVKDAQGLSPTASLLLCLQGGDSCKEQRHQRLEHESAEEQLV